MLVIQDKKLVEQLQSIADEEKRPKEVVRRVRQKAYAKARLSTEVVYLLKREVSFQDAIDFVGDFADSFPDLQDVTGEDLKRVKDIKEHYRDARFDFVDCCLMALSERLNITQVCTLDQHDFSIFRPKHCPFLEILP